MKCGDEMMKERISARVRDAGIGVFAAFGYHTSRSREYDFVIDNLPPKGNKILDVGSTGSLLPLKLAKKGYDVHSIDVRSYHEKHPNLTTLCTDIKDTPFTDDFFDAIICVSTIEHVGLSAYGDPEYDGGDVLSMKEFRRILKEDGRLILTTPFAGEYKVLHWRDTYERIYNYEKIRALFTGWGILKEEYYIPQKMRHWIKATRNEAEKVYASYDKSNLSCFVLEKNVG